MSAGLLHYHFDTKEQLFAEVLTYSSAVSSELNQQAARSAPANDAGRSGSRPSSTAACPATTRLAHEWLLWQELDLLCLRQPELAKVGRRRSTRTSTPPWPTIITDGHRGRRLRPPTADARMVAETAVALCDGLGARVLANDPDLTLAEARATLAATRRHASSATTARCRRRPAR